MINNVIKLILTLDIKLFYFINHNLKNYFFDSSMVFITETKNFYIVFFLIWLSLILFGKYKGRITALSVVVGLTLSDLISSRILKNIIRRDRPFYVLEDVNKLVSAYGFSFPSSHAVNSFTAATILVLFYSKKIQKKSSFKQKMQSCWVFLVSYFFAFLSAFSRVYVGVHYPSDVILGSFIGILIGFFVYKISIAIFPVKKLRIVS